MPKKIIWPVIILVSAIISDHLDAQDSSEHFIRYHIGYSGNTFINPGVCFQLESELKERSISLFSHPMRSSYVGSATFAGYWDPFSHTGFHYFVDYSRRFYLLKRFSLQLGAGAGWMMIFLPESYTYTNSGDFRRSYLNHYGFLAPEISSGWRVFNKKRDKSFGSRLLIHFPWRYNLFTVPVISFELSYQF